MTQQIINLIRTASPGPQKGKGHVLPTWEFFYTGTLWRLARGSKTRKLNRKPADLPFPLER